MCCVRTTAACHAALLAAVALAGCGGSSYQVAEVDGVLLIGGQPGHQVQVQFFPDVAGESSPPPSMATTDGEGCFSLRLMEGAGGSTRAGAVVGTHRVVLRDLQLAASATGAGVPIRLGQPYTLPGSTPLRQEIVAGKQTIEIQVPAAAGPPPR